MSTRWLTVVSPEDPDGTELLLEPSDHPAVSPFKAALVRDGIPFTSFAVDDVAREHERLVGARCAVHPTTHRDGPRDHRGVRRHVRQPHPDRRAELLTAAVDVGAGERPSIGSVMVTVPREELSRQWEVFAERECRGYSPLYESICRSVAVDDDLLALVESGPPSARQPNVLLAAVHYLLLGGVDHPLAEVYAGRRAPTRRRSSETSA